MMVTGVKRAERFRREADDLQPYERLVELQRQMMTLAEQNAETERECAMLRARIAVEAEALFRSRRSLIARLQRRGQALLRHLLGAGRKPAPAAPPRSGQPARPGPHGWVCQLADDGGTQT